MSAEVTVIIIHWNTPELLDQLLSGLLSPKLQVIVVDNNSTGSLALLEKKYSTVEWIFNPENLGYARACNQGSARARSPWLLFLNPDVKINATEVIKLIEHGDQQHLDAFSPQSDSANYRKPIPSVLSLLVEFTPLGKLIPLSLFHSQTLVGGLLAIKKEILLKIGGWDEQFFLWFEDSDLTKRLVDSGYKTGFIQSEISHVGGSSVSKLVVIEQRLLFFTSMRRYADKHFSRFGIWIVKLLARRYEERS